EMRAAPPGDEAMRLAVPTLALEERRDRLGQPLLHVDDGAILIEGQRLDLASEHFGRCHGVSLRFREGLPGAEGRVGSTVLPGTPPSAFSFLFHRADGEACDEPVDEKIVDDRNRQTRDQTCSHHGTPEIDVAAHQKGRYANAYGVASRRG